MIEKNVEICYNELRLFLGEKIMEIVFALLCLAIVGVIVYYIVAKSESKTKLKEVCETHTVDISFSTSSGYLAFCDNERKLYFYSTTTHSQVVINYEKLILAGVPDENSSLILINIANPEYTQYQFGAQNSENKKTILDKLGNIIATNLSQAKMDYEKIISIPTNASQVTVKHYTGINAEIPGGIWNKNTYLWVENETLYLMSVFANLVDFKTRRNVYKPIVIDSKNIVELSQDGNVHYTTNIHGGGGGGSSIKGAIIGGLIAGEVGAIIGSRKPNEPITSSTSKIDDRETILKVLDSNNNLFEISFDYNDYYLISKLLAI